MTLQEITDMMGDLLEVDLDRYGQTVREIHVNQAISEDLASENDFPFDQIIEDLSSSLTGSSFSLATLASRKIIRVKSIWDADIELEPVKYTDLGAVLTSPTKFTQYGMTVYLNGPIEALGTVSITGKAKAIHLSTLANGITENDWTNFVPYLVAYSACIHSSVWLVEEERVPLFAAMVKQALIKASVEYDFEIESSGQLEEM